VVRRIIDLPEVGMRIIGLREVVVARIIDLPETGCIRGDL